MNKRVNNTLFKSFPAAHDDDDDDIKKDGKDKHDKDTPNQLKHDKGNHDKKIIHFCPLVLYFFYLLVLLGANF